MCFTEPEWKFFNDRHHEVSNFYSLPEIHISIVIESLINTQNSKIIAIFEPNLKLRPIVGDRKCPTRKVSQIIQTLLKPFLKHIKTFICDSLDFLNKCPGDVDKDTEIFTFDLVSLFTSIPHRLGLKAIDYFMIKYPEDLHARFRKEFILKSANIIVNNNTLTFDS